MGGFSHETNSFSNIPVTMDVLEKNTWEGSGFVEQFTGVEGYEGGLIDEARELGVELVPTRMSVLYPSGASTREVFETSRDRLAELLAEAYEKQPYDGIALVLHGAAVADGYPDPEGEILVAIRQRLGREIPIGIKCYPHVDEYAMGRRLMRQGGRPPRRIWWWATSTLLSAPSAPKPLTTGPSWYPVWTGR